MMKLLSALVLGLLAIEMVSADGERRQFWRHGRKHEQVVQDGDDFMEIEIPESQDSDEVLIRHDFNKELTLYKDKTAQLCFLSPLIRHVVNTRGILFKYVRDMMESSGTKDIVLHARGHPLNLAKISPQFAEICRGLLTFSVLEDEASEKRNKRLRRSWSFSSSSSVSTDGDETVKCHTSSRGEETSSTGCGTDTDGNVSGWKEEDGHLTVFHSNADNDRDGRPGRRGRGRGGRHQDRDGDRKGRGRGRDNSDDGENFENNADDNDDEDNGDGSWGSWFKDVFGA